MSAFVNAFSATCYELLKRINLTYTLTQYVSIYVKCQKSAAPKMLIKPIILHLFLACNAWPKLNSSDDFIGQLYFTVLSRRSHKNTGNKPPYLVGQNAIPGWWWLFISYMNLVHIVCLDLIHRAWTNIDIPDGRWFHQWCIEYISMVSSGLSTHWGPNTMAAILQTTFSNAFSWMKMFDFSFSYVCS